LQDQVALEEAQRGHGTRLEADLGDAGELMDFKFKRHSDRFPLDRERRIPAWLQPRKP